MQAQIVGLFCFVFCFICLCGENLHKENYLAAYIHVFAKKLDLSFSNQHRSSLHVFIRALTLCCVGTEYSCDAVDIMFQLKRFDMVPLHVMLVMPKS